MNVFFSDVKSITQARVYLLIQEVLFSFKKYLTYIGSTILLTSVLLIEVRFVT